MPVAVVTSRCRRRLGSYRRSAGVDGVATRGSPALDGGYVVDSNDFWTHLGLVTLAFVAGRAEGLRGEKPGGDGGAGVPGAELGLPELAGPPAGDDGAAVHGGSHRLPPAA